MLQVTNFIFLLVSPLDSNHGFFYKGHIFFILTWWLGDFPFGRDFFALSLSPFGLAFLLCLSSICNFSEESVAIMQFPLRLLPPIVDIVIALVKGQISWAVVNWMAFTCDWLCGHWRSATGGGIFSHNNPVESLYTLDIVATTGELDATYE